MEKRDTFNEFGIGVQGDYIVFIFPRQPVLSKPQALKMAAFLVALADDSENESEFRAWLDAVKNA